MGVIVNVRGSNNNMVRSATVKISNKTYDRPIQRLYKLKGWDRVRSTNELLHLIGLDTFSQTTDDVSSQIAERNPY